jgi:DNA processing protein
MNRRTLAWLVLNHLPGAGAVTLRRLASRLGSPEAALAAPVGELAAIGSLSAAQMEELSRLLADLPRIERLAANLEQAGISLLTLDDSSYPENLRALRDAPPLLYLRGTLRPQDAAAVAIVGTRTPSDAGESAAVETGQVLASSGVTVVSGLARGVDAAAHRGALAAKRTPIASGSGALGAEGSAAGRTIAVLGSGIDRVTPARHRGLGDEIARSGALVSEVPPSARATRETLLARNRIQAGLSKAVIVIQCRRRGGSFSTARRALAQGRPVFAVLWHEAEFAEGARRLEAMGARAVSATEAIESAAEAAFKPLPRAAQCEMSLDDSPYVERGE